ncbi:unnamed protein product [Ectocarpus sp. 13 AM-2016]
MQLLTISVLFGLRCVRAYAYACGLTQTTHEKVVEQHQRDDRSAHQLALPLESRSPLNGESKDTDRAVESRLLNLVYSLTIEYPSPSFFNSANPRRSFCFCRSTRSLHALVAAS